MILFTYGTRPEYLKVKPLIDEFKKQNLNYRVLFTGQHKDLVPQDESVIQLNDTGNLSYNRLDNVLGKIMWDADDAFELLAMYNLTEDITHVLVQGDTTSVLGMAISAFHHKLKVIHLEAGLRTNDLDNPYPEEANRQMVSRITDIHLAPTQLAKDNLLLENINEEDIHVVGNTALDNLVEYLEKCEYGDKVLVTLHRRENHDKIDEWFQEIEKLAIKYNDLEFILPLHPNPNVQKHKNILKKVNVIKPLLHSELLDILVKSKLVITDSGGIQEECSFFKKICLVCRKTTERPESVGLTSILVSAPEHLSNYFNIYHKEYKPKDHECPYGDGRSSKLITEILKRNIYANK